jgi:phosphatidate cytidylyltransferase
MDRNFKVRVVVGAGMFVVALVSLYLFDAIPFKIIFAFCALLAVFELMSFFFRKHTKTCYFLAAIEFIMLICASVFMIKLKMPLFWYIILGVSGYDIFAYFSGKALGGKIFGKARPFPHISKNKTWEGTIFGLLIATVLVLIMMAARGAFETEWMYLLSAPLALIGDLYESFTKRRFDVKDSNEIVRRNPLMRKIEILVGGSDGHGGFLDRIDSVAFATTVFLIISIATGAMR